jgi:hypothetical protein
MEYDPRSDLEGALKTIEDKAAISIGQGKVPGPKRDDLPHEEDTKSERRWR